MADAAAQRADAWGREADAALARAVAATMRTHLGECSPDELERLARQALPLLEAADDDDGLVSVWRALGLAATMRARFADWAEASEEALVHARHAGHAVVGSFYVAVPLAMGPMPASEALTKLDALVGGQPHAGDLIMRAGLLAMLDQIEEAWAVAVPAEERLRELGFDTAGGVWLGEIAEIAADHQAAARYFREACDALEASGNTAVLSTYAPRLGRVLCALGRYDEAEPLAAKGRELGDPEDVMTQQAWREAQALVHSARGRNAEAERLAREAVEFGLRTDSPLLRGDALATLAEVLDNADRRDEAVMSSVRRSPSTNASRSSRSPATSGNGSSRSRRRWREASWPPPASVWIFSGSSARTTILRISRFDRHSDLLSAETAQLPDNRFRHPKANYRGLGFSCCMRDLSSCRRASERPSAAGASFSTIEIE